ncbi:MAG: HAMP domain-containing histidine kinase [Neomegalonema sp.]|nr:HAMP domain-containing histidine kinase [Neomegalonema sp.]
MAVIKAFWQSLSGRLLILTVIFVMLAEILIFVPSVSRFRLDYLRERLDNAGLAALAVEANPRRIVSQYYEQELLRGAGVLSVAVQNEGRRELLLMSPQVATVEQSYDIRDPRWYRLIYDTFATLFVPEEQTARVIGYSFRDVPRIDPNLGNALATVEVVIEQSALRSAMLDYGVRIFWLSLFISGLTAALVFWAVNRALVWPMSRIVDSISSFRSDPEDLGDVIAPSGATGEIAVAERELAAMQSEIRAALRQKSRLAALGEAVAKINHDLRNLLSTAQLLADRLESSRDPLVVKVGPKLINSLDRAIRLCRETLEYGRAQEPAPQRQSVALRALGEEIEMALGLREDERISFANQVAPEHHVLADPDQLFRALHNIARNAAQAIQATGEPGQIMLAAWREGGACHIDLSDTGPGLPEAARKDLFKPFKGSVRKGGSGLGIAIAAELMRGHGGSLSLIESNSEGTCFRLVLPDDPAQSAQASQKENATLETNARRTS